MHACVHACVRVYIYIYPHGARSASGELIGNLVKVSLGWHHVTPFIYRGRSGILDLL